MMTEKEKMQKQMLYDMDYTPRTLNEMIGVLFRILYLFKSCYHYLCTQWKCMHFTKGMFEHLPSIQFLQQLIVPVSA